MASGLMDNNIEKLGAKANTWLKSKFPLAEFELIVSHPWARTWKMTDIGQVYYVKQIRQGGLSKVICAEAIAKVFQESVPNVLSANPDLGIIVFADHGGIELKSRSKNIGSVLTSYAKLQLESIKHAETLSCIPQIDISSIYNKFLRFLDGNATENGEGLVTANYYLGHQKAHRYYLLFSEIEPLLAPVLKQASNLPFTINHCDLRPPNMARKSDDSIVFFDWDDAKWGPIGMSLHAQFSGCLRPLMAFNSEHDQVLTDQEKSDLKHLNSYINVFTKNDISSSESLSRDLPAAALVGTINYILDFENYPETNSETRKAVGRNIRKRLESILDYVDAISYESKQDSQQLASSYFKNSFHRRLKNLQKSCKRPLIDIPNLNSHALENARELGVFPTMSFADFEMQHGICTDENARLAAKIYKEQGAVLLENSLSTDLIKACREYVFEKHKTYFNHGQPDDSLRVGRKRFMTTLPLEGPFNHSELYANPIIMRIMRRLLGDNFILGSMVVVTSLPGSTIQSRHRDHHALFREDELVLPPFAVSVMIPLIDMNEEVGATRIFKGSHLQPTDIANKMPGQDPTVNVGSCFLMDYRVQHRGMPNLSKDTVRPVMTLIFQRPWFRDYVNYNKQERMIIPEKELKKVPSEFQNLFNWK